MIVVGGSLGGCEALCVLLERLPADFPLPIAVALHRHRDSDGMLQPVVQRASRLIVVEPDDKIRAEPGHVYLCPPDYHLLVDEDCLAVSTDELVNFARPALDVLFDSAAAVLGRRAIAVVLSGAGFDGAAGARRIAKAGGIVLVQRPTGATGPWMPAAAIAASRTRHVFELERLAAVLLRLARRRTAR